MLSFTQWYTTFSCIQHQWHYSQTPVDGFLAVSIFTTVQLSESVQGKEKQKRQKEANTKVKKTHIELSFCFSFI